MCLVIDAYTVVLMDEQDRLADGVEFLDKSYIFSSICLVSVEFLCSSVCVLLVCDICGWKM